jgi:hypothetical protein
VNNTVNAVANSKYIRSHTNSNILTLFDGGDLLNSCYEDSAVDAGSDLKSLDRGVDVNLAFFATCDNQFAVKSTLRVEFLRRFDGNTFIKTVHFESSVDRFYRRERVINPLYQTAHMHFDCLTPLIMIYPLILALIFLPHLIILDSLT